MKLSKVQIKQHEECLRLLEKETLTLDERKHVIENWIPAYGSQIGKSGTFFTPLGLARDVAANCFGNNAIDLCAGIGRLAFTYYHYFDKKFSVTCLEINPDFVEVGKKIVPEATWICGDVLDEKLIKSLGTFDIAMSNPPFGNIKTGIDSGWLEYQGCDFEYKVVEAARHLTTSGVFIMPQMSVPFKYSGERNFREIKSDKYDRFHKQTGITLEMNCGFDTSIYADEWMGTRQIPEIALVDYSEIAA